jgi:hypothetical protein
VNGICFLTQLGGSSPVHSLFSAGTSAKSFFQVPSLLRDPCYLCDDRIFEHYLAIGLDVYNSMGHIIEVPPGNDQGPLLNHTSIALYSIAVFFVAIRFITRACLVKKFGLDDLFIAVAVVSC